MNIRYATLFAAVAISFNANAFDWGTDYSNDMYIHTGVSASMCKPFVDDAINQMYDNESGEFYGYMHRNHPLGETEEHGVYGLARDVDMDTKTSYGCEFVYVSYDATNEGDYKSRVSFAVSETVTEGTVIYINSVEKK